MKEQHRWVIDILCFLTILGTGVIFGSAIILNSTPIGLLGLVSAYITRSVLKVWLENA
jgi:hypothetical protein